MNLIRDYLGFAIRFAGIGYVVLWPLAAAGDGMPFGGPYVCGAIALVCEIDQPLMLPPGIHALGALATIAMIGLVSVRFLRRLRRPAGIGATVPRARLSAVVDHMTGQSTLRMPRRVRPRSEFGLRRPAPQAAGFGISVSTTGPPPARRARGGGVAS